MMLLPMLNPLFKSLMLAAVSWYISFIMLALYAYSNFFAFSEAVNEGRVFIRPYPITLKLPFTPRSIY